MRFPCRFSAVGPFINSGGFLPEWRAGGAGDIDCLRYRELRNGAHPRRSNDTYLPSAWPQFARHADASEKPVQTRRDREETASKGTHRFHLCPGWGPIDRGRGSLRSAPRGTRGHHFHTENKGSPGAAEKR